MHVERFTVVFLMDGEGHIMLLKRAADKAFAPNFYTGIGGHQEEGEAIMATAYRELEEETGLTGIPLTEFARGIINDGVILHYFGGDYADASVPQCTEGTLEWVHRADITADMSRIVPTTAAVIREWARRDFDVNQTWTLYVKRLGLKDTVAQVAVEKVVDGLEGESFMELVQCVSCDGYGWVTDDFTGEDEDCTWCDGTGYVYRDEQGIDHKIPEGDYGRVADQLEKLEKKRLNDMGYTGSAKHPSEQDVRKGD